MTDEQPPKPPKPPRGRPRRPKDFDDVPELSPEEVARRVDVRGGGSPRAPIVREPLRDRRPPPRRVERSSTARDSLLLIGLVIVGLVAVRVFLPDGPLTGNSTGPPGTQAAVASPTLGASSTGLHTGGLITLPPTPTGTAGPITEPPITPVPVPTRTLKPGETPRPTPKPTKTPTPTHTATPSTGPTPPGTATVIVAMHIVNDDGGDAVAANWKMKITGEVGAGVSPNNFDGSESGTSVTITAGEGYLVTDNLAVSGYGAPSPTSDCHRDAGSGGLSSGQVVTCTITRNDLSAHVDVTIAIVGNAPADDPVLSISGANASPTSVSGAGTTSVRLDSNASWSVDYSSGAAGYSMGTSGNCGNSGLNEGQTVSCTFTFTEPVAPPGPSIVVPFIPFLLPRRWATRRWRPTRTS